MSVSKDKLEQLRKEFEKFTDDPKNWDDGSDSVHEGRVFVWFAEKLEEVWRAERENHLSALIVTENMLEKFCGLGLFTDDTQNELEDLMSSVRKIKAAVVESLTTK